MDSIYTYFDYRKYLKDPFEDKKDQNSAISLRAIASRIGINSGTLVRILGGERNISKKLVPSFTDFLKLKGKETLYFINLVEFNQAKSNEKQRFHYVMNIESQLIRTNTNTMRTGTMLLSGNC